MNSCIHSDSNYYSSGNTVWYNYSTASAGNIIDKNTNLSNPAVNTNTATESICPKGWNLPSKKQMDNNRGITDFNSILGGGYKNGTLSYESMYGDWWGSETYNGAMRYSLGYNGSSLYTGYDSRNAGYYIRCVSEEKTVTDLTYMQDMTPKIAPVLSLCI